MNDPTTVTDFPPVTVDPRPVVLHGDVSSDPPNAPRPPTPRTIPLPLGGSALMFAREQLTVLFRCSHGELGRLVKARLAPSPIRVGGQILWFVDESLNAQAQVERTLNRWRKR